MSKLNPSTYIRYRGKADPVEQGSLTLKTEGQFTQDGGPQEIVGKEIDISDFHLHSYQLIPEKLPGVDGTFKIEVSNDGETYSPLACWVIPDENTPVVYSDYFNFKYARVKVTGAEGKYTILERHNSYS